jgi:hypothetical protein
MPAGSKKTVAAWVEMDAEGIFIHWRTWLEGFWMGSIH